ncbi:hypothetical protein Tco_0407655 [Tanacetum coccineum]
MKARATLLMALPNKDQLKFHTYQDVKLLMEAIEKRYGGNKESKKVTKTHWTVGDLRRSDQSRRYELKVAEKSSITEWKSIMLYLEKETMFPRNQEFKGRENNTRTIIVETPTQNALIAQDGYGGYNWSYQAEEEQPTNNSLMAFTSRGSSSSSESEYQFNLVSYKAGLKSVEARLVHYKKNEIVLEDSINVLTLEVRLRDNALDVYKLNLEKAEAEIDQLKQTLEKFQNSSKSLNEILECQVIDKFKKGLGYNAATAASPTVEGFVNLTDKSRTNKAYHAVSLPLTGNFIPCKPNLTFIDEIMESENLDVTTIVTPSNDKTVADRDISNIIESNAVRMDNTSAPINEDWNSDDESKIDYTIVPSFEKTKSVKTVREIDAAKQNHRGNQRN